MPSFSQYIAIFGWFTFGADATYYSLLYDFDGSNFFQNFSVISEVDPTAGFVEYLDYQSATTAGLASTKSGHVYLRADSSNIYSTGGRPSIRVESDFVFSQGLLIADLAHMPGNGCGIWPAFWTYGPEWPTNGEIDIIEGVNMQSMNDMTLHTGIPCKLSNSTMQGTIRSSDCSKDSSVGCVISGPEHSFGDSFNSAGGGIYAMELTSHSIKIWHFSRTGIPDSVTSASSDPNSFGPPVAYFKGCDIQSAFDAQTIVFDIDFCGGWGSGGFGTNMCPMTVPNDAYASCRDFVGNNPSAFAEAYWEIVSLRLYKQSSSNSTLSCSPGIENS